MFTLCKRRINTEYLLNDDVRTAVILGRYLQIKQKIKICHEFTRLESRRGVIPLILRVFQQQFLY